MTQIPPSTKNCIHSAACEYNSTDTRWDKQLLAATEVDDQSMNYASQGTIIIPPDAAHTILYKKRSEITNIHREWCCHLANPTESQFTPYVLMAENPEW